MISMLQSSHRTPPGSWELSLNVVQPHKELLSSGLVGWRTDLIFKHRSWEALELPWPRQTEDGTRERYQPWVCSQSSELELFSSV